MPANAALEYIAVKDRACTGEAQPRPVSGLQVDRDLPSRVKRHGWKAIIQGFDILKAKVGVDQYIEVLKEAVGRGI